MSVVVIATGPGLSPQPYDRSHELMGLVGQLPPGCASHIAGPGRDGRWGGAVWESADATQRFTTERLRPAPAQLGVVTPGAPPVVFPLHAQIG
jgi:hypothetical protein